MFCSLILVLKTLYLYNDIIHLSYQTPPFSVFLYQYLIILLKKNVGNFKNSDLANLSGLENLTVLTDSKSWQAANGIHFALWGANTLGTPYKQNLTSVSAGIQIVGRVSENNQFWISIDANGKMYKTYYDRGTDAWSQWTAI